MKTKNRCEKVCYNIQQKNFERNYTSIRYLQSILTASEGIEQINLLKEVEHYLLQKDLTEEELILVASILCTMYYQAPLKSAQKKTLRKIIQETSKKCPTVVEACLHENLKRVTICCPQNMKIEELEKFVLYIICLMDNLTIGKKVLDENSDEIWIYISLILKTVVQTLKQESTSQKINDWSSLCQNILKLISHVIQSSDRLKDYLKCNCDTRFQTASDDIGVSLKYLLTSDEIKLNCRLNAAFAYCNYSHISFGVNNLNDLLDESFKYPLSSRLCLYSSIMAVLPAEEFIKDTDAGIADKIFDGILEISKISNSSEILLQCARGILQWTSVILNILSKDTAMNKIFASKIFTMFSDDEKLLKNLFEYVLHIRDHFIDSLRHLGKDIFQNILNLHILSSGTEPRKSVLLKEMTLYLLKDLPAHNRGKYGMLRCIVEKIGTETVLEWDSSLPSELYKVLEEHSLVSHVSELYQVLFSCSMKTVDDENFQKVWLVPLLDVLCKGSKEQTSAINEHILPKLLLVKPSTLTFLLSALSSMWEENIGNSFSALVTCMKLYQKQKGAVSYLEFISTESLMKAFCHADDQVRISAFALLCENFKTTEPIDSNTLQLIKYGLPFNINCQSPPFRQQLISYMKKLFARILESGYAMSKKKQSFKTEDSKDLQNMLLPDIYQEFFKWLKNFLFSCLYPGANFPRRVTSLNLLYILHEMFSGSISIVDSEVIVKTLIYTLQDTYDNNRYLALQLLTSKFSLQLNVEGEKLFNSALILASSTKPPDTTTAAYLFAYIVESPQSFQHIIMKKLSLISQCTALNFTESDNSHLNSDLHFRTTALLTYELNNQLQLARKNLLEAAACAPLYGILTCIRSVLNNVKIFHTDSYIEWQQLIRGLITLSFSVAYVVEPIVCNSSPEGHLPMDTDNESIAQLQAAVRKALGNRFQSAVVIEEPSTEPDSLVLDIVKTHAVTAQLLLLCCWRTHREVSLLFGDLTDKLPLFDRSIESSTGILSADQVKDIGTYFLYQMSLVKHRGAFEQAHIGLSKMCCRLWRCNIEQLNVLPKVWLEDMILAIKGLKEKIQLCPTRRSAGLPFIIQAIVASEPSVSNSLFFKKSVSTFLDLAQSSEEDSSDVQVHALNVLRTLFRDASLGETVMQFVSEGLKISITGFKSPYWAVRNSSTLLFSALMTRVFGVNRSHDETGKKNRLSAKNFYSYYKSLYTFFIHELKRCAESVKNSASQFFIEPSLCPILLLLARLYPAPGEEDTILSVFIPYLNVCVSSPIWKTRKLAAKALVAFTPQEKILSNLDSLIKELNSDVPLIQNKVHGKLLQVLYYMEEINNLPDFDKNSLKTVFEAFKNCFDLYIKNNKCASTRASFLMIFLYFMVLDVELDSSALIETFYEGFQHPCTTPDKDNYTAVGVAILFLKELEVYNNKTECDIQTIQPSIKFLNFFRNYHELIRNFTVIEILLWLLQDTLADSKHCLKTSDDIVVVQKVLKTVMLMDKKKYNPTFFIEEYLQYIIGILENVTDPSLLRQVFKLLSLIPSSFLVEWKFLKRFYSFHLIDKLDYVLNLIEIHSRDDVICELLIYSSHLIVKLSEEYASFHKESNFTERDVEVIKDWLEKIEEYALPDNSILLRNTVVIVLKILVQKSVFPKSSLLGSLNLWQPLLLVLIDDEPDIKYRASEIVMKIKFPQNEGNGVSSVVPSKAVELMMEIFVEINYEDPVHCVSMLISWMLSSDMISYENMTDEQPFDKGELNVYAEDLNLTNIVRNHLFAYLSSLNSSKQILSEPVFFWGHKKSLTLADIIMLCLSEANVAVENFLSRGAISPLLDAYFDQDFIYISPRLDIAIVLLPYCVIQSEFSTIGNELLRQFQSLDFRTFFIEDLISKIECFLNQL